MHHYTSRTAKLNDIYIIITPILISILKNSSDTMKSTRVKHLFSSQPSCKRICDKKVLWGRQYCITRELNHGRIGAAVFLKVLGISTVAIHGSRISKDLAWFGLVGLFAGPNYSRVVELLQWFGGILLRNHSLKLEDWPTRHANHPRHHQGAQQQQGVKPKTLPTARSQLIPKLLLAGS